MVIHASGKLDIYMEPILLETTAKFFLHLPNVRLFVPSQKQILDKDLCELLKINWFINTMENIKKVGVLLGDEDKGLLKNIEQWPIIQSYGQGDLEKGFFSLDHQVSDMTLVINQIYKNYDGFGLKQQINQTSEKLASHVYNSFLLVMNTKFNKRPMLSE